MIFNLYTISAFINFLTSIVLAVLVVLKNRKNPKNVSFSILATLVSLWSLCYFFWQNVEQAEWLALFLCRALMAFTIMIPAAYLHFVLALTETLEKRKKFLIFVYLLFYFFLLTNATPFFIEKVEPIMNFKFWPVATPIMSLWFFSFGVCVFYSAFLLIKKYRGASGITKLQLKYVAIGTIISFICGTLNFAPWYGIPLPPVANSFVPFYVILMAYAITRYRFMDIKTLTRNITFYFIIAVFAYLSFYLFAHAYKIIFGDPLARGGYVLGLVVAPVFAVIAYKISGSLSKFLNKRVFYFLYVYEQEIKKAQNQLRRYNSLDQVADVIINTIRTTLQTEKIAVLFCNSAGKEINFEVTKKIGFTEIPQLSCALFSEYFKKEYDAITREELEQTIENTKDAVWKKTLHSIENQIHRYNISTCIPLKDSENLLGIIVIGAKRFEGSYSKEDFGLLKT